MRFLIPSYKRAGHATTIDLLAKFGLKSEEIIVSTQTKDDYKSYKDAYGAVASIVFGDATNLAGNANTALRQIKDGEIAAIMDDDIRGIQVYDQKEDGTARGRRARGDEFLSYIEETRRAMEDSGVNLCVAYPTENPLSMKSALKSGRIVKNRLGSGWLILVRGGAVKFDETLDSCEDYDIQLNEICSGRDILRLNFIGPITTPRSRKYGEQQGGRGFYYEDNEHRKNILEVVSRYYPIAKTNAEKTKILIDTRYS